MADFAFAGEIAGKLFNIGALLFFGLIVLGGAYLAHTEGLLANRPYKCPVYFPRATGKVKEKMANGRFLKEGKFEIYYGFRNKVIIEAPGEEFIDEGNIIRFVRQSRDAHFPTTLQINPANDILADPAWSNATKVALFRELEQNAHRFGNDALSKYAPYIAIIAGFVIVGIAWYVSTGVISEQLGEVARQFGGVAESLKDAQVIIDKPATPPG